MVPGEEDLGPLACEGARDRAADPTARSVNNRNLVLEDHGSFLPVNG
jgi:hypothetical protein